MIDKYGADPVRFYMMTNSEPWDNLKFDPNGVGHAPVGFSKRGRDTESDANIQPEEMLTFFSNEFPPAFPHEIPKYVSKPYYLSTQSTICLLRQFLFLL